MKYITEYVEICMPRYQQWLLGAVIATSVNNACVTVAIWIFTGTKP